ncbi:MAG: ribonuclease III [Lachnospiraceae bacterium]|nr:ribonuclease III [Lachnospiraceae bacterium]
MADLKEFESKIKYEFQDKSLLKHALIHSSYANEKHMKKFSDNEKLEFLGDAVLELVSSEFLFNTYTELSEGDLSKLRASLVCEPTLAYCTKAIDLDKYVYLGNGEERTGGRQRKSILSDALEAVIGAIFLDGGIEKAKAFILEFILTDIEHKRLFHDSKTTLQEVTQAKFSEGVTYVIVSENGPDHAKEYGVQALVGSEVLGEGKGSSKKAAEQEAAYQALLKLHMENKINIVNK